MRVFVLNNYFIGALPDEAQEINAQPPLNPENARWNGDRWVQSQRVFVKPDGTFFGTFDAVVNPMADTPKVFSDEGCVEIEAPVPLVPSRWDFEKNIWVAVELTPQPEDI